jgi:hypothetical protein
MSEQKAVEIFICGSFFGQDPSDGSNKEMKTRLSAQRRNFTFRQTKK